jgi:hypothetical protein
VEDPAVLRMLTAVSVVIAYLHTPEALTLTLEQLETYKDYLFALVLALLAMPTVRAWFE